MAPGDKARKYLDGHHNDILSSTGKPPVILDELAHAIHMGKDIIADNLVANYAEGQGIVGLRDQPPATGGARERQG